VAPDDLVKAYPRLYHMAEGGSWPNIRKHGLLSTTALLDLFGIKGKARVALEEEHRPVSVPLNHTSLSSCMLRDQRPMPPARLRACLPRHVKPSDWYRLLNGKVFFWTSRDRLITMLNAHNYRNRRHDVLIIDTPKLVDAYQKAINLCHMNSGNTFPYLHKKTPEIFKTIAEYRLKRDGSPRPPVVEVVVDYSVPDVRQFVIDVRSQTSTRDYGSLLL
jgi:hypothetical protein